MIEKVWAEYRGGGLWHIIREGLLLVGSRILEAIIFKHDSAVKRLDKWV